MVKSTAEVKLERLYNSRSGVCRTGKDIWYIPCTVATLAQHG